MSTSHIFLMLVLMLFRIVATTSPLNYNLDRFFNINNDPVQSCNPPNTKEYFCQSSGEVTICQLSCKNYIGEKLEKSYARNQA